MLLEVKDFDWWETNEQVIVKIPLRGAPSKSIDIFSSDIYIKVSFQNNIFELVPHQPIEDEASKCTISEGMLLLHLQKKNKVLWNTLSHEQHKDKEFMKNIRKEAFELKQKQEAERKEKRATEKDEQKKFTVREQMRIDNLERMKREESKKLENAEACQEIEHFSKINSYQDTSRLQLESASESGNYHTTTDDAYMRQLKEKEEKAAKNFEAQEEKKVEKEVPAPRSRGSINFTFTERKLATPARESKAPEEEAWLQKVAAFNKIKEEAKQKVDADDPEEMNPMWLKDKGNAFYKQGHFVAAINAYTTGIILDPRIPMLYANRAACHLHLKQYKECIQDCTMAMENFVPECEANRVSRCRALTRRGTAYYNLELYVESLMDYESAIKLDPRNSELKIDAKRIRKIVQGDESGDEQSV